MTLYTKRAIVALYSKLKIISLKFFIHFLFFFFFFNLSHLHFHPTNAKHLSFSLSHLQFFIPLSLSLSLSLTHTEPLNQIWRALTGTNKDWMILGLDFRWISIGCGLYEWGFGWISTSCGLSKWGFSLFWVDFGRWVWVTGCGLYERWRREWQNLLREMIRWDKKEYMRRKRKSWIKRVKIEKE